MRHARRAVYQPAARDQPLRLQPPIDRLAIDQRGARHPNAGFKRQMSEGSAGTSRSPRARATTRRSRSRRWSPSRAGASRQSIHAASPSRAASGRRPRGRHPRARAQGRRAMRRRQFDPRVDGEPTCLISRLRKSWVTVDTRCVTTVCEPMANRQLAVMSAARFIPSDGANAFGSSRSMFDRPATRLMLTCSPGRTSYTSLIADRRSQRPWFHDRRAPWATRHGSAAARAATIRAPSGPAGPRPLPTRWSCR